MGDAGGLNHPRAYQFNRLDTEMLEQSDTATKQHRHKVHLDFVEQSGLEALLCDACGTDSNMLVPGNFFGSCNRTFDAIADKGEHRRFPCPRLGKR